MPKQGPDVVKIKKIKDAIRNNPDGLWVRELSRKTGISRSTVSLYINSHMKGEVEDAWKGGFIRIVKLRNDGNS